jgi:N4-gp56 family major capsid protein
MEFTWTNDVTDGSVLKCHAMSNALLEHAAQDLVCAQFATPVDGFGKKMGETVTLYHFKPLDVPSDATLKETNRIPIDKIEMGSRAITVSEWGRGVQYTSLSENLSKFSPRDAVQKKLTEQMQFVIDNAVADAFATAKIAFQPTSLTGGTFDTDGTPSTTATHNLTVAHLAAIRDYMASTIHVPFYKKNHYIGIFATKSLRGIKDDRYFQAWNQYLQKGDVLFNSEVGMVESIRLIENTNASAFTNGVGTGSVLGEGVVFGDEAIAQVEVETPELRADPNYQSDFGRIKAVAWYGVMAYATWWDSADDREAKIIRVTSA